MIQEQVRELKERLVEYARFIEEMIERSVQAILEPDDAGLREIVNSKEDTANAREMDLERECTALIAQHQPKARDLRSILMVLGMTNDLERMGDHAVNIAEAGLHLLERSSIKPPEKLSEMARETIGMVDRGIRAFVAEEPDAARGVCADDSVVDDLAAAILKDVVYAMEREPSLIEPDLSILKIAANLERIADLSTNICEDVIYLVEGKVIKHHREDGSQ
jgi:phosphate transport system protein